MASSSSGEPEQDPEPDEPTIRLDPNNASSQSLVSGAGSGYESQYGSLFGSRFSLTDGSGIFISSLALTIIISAIAVVGIVLVAVIITLAVMVSSCGGRHSSVTRQLEGSVDICASMRLNMELNNIQGRAPPAVCDKKIFEYVHGGQYIKDVEMAVNSARFYLKSLGLEGNQSFGVVFDIDETMLLNTFLFQSGGYRSQGFLDQRLECWMNRTRAVPMSPVLELYNELRAANRSIFLISERPESAFEVTVQNLFDAGYEGWRGLFLRSAAGDAELSVQAFKSNKRLKIENQGYQILTVVGDQWSDIVGPATGNRTFKLPNPIYQTL